MSVSINGNIVDVRRSLINSVSAARRAVVIKELELVHAKRILDLFASRKEEHPDLYLEACVRYQELLSR